VVASRVASQTCGALVEQAALLGLPVSVLPAGVVVVDLGALWAGPPCGSILADAGATVVKVDAPALVARADGPRVWCSITGHGREGEARDRVGFGDDAAVAGGLVVWQGADPRFCGDATAAPATAPRHRGRAPALGADTAAVLDELGVA